MRALRQALGRKPFDLAREGSDSRGSCDGVHQRPNSNSIETMQKCRFALLVRGS